MSAISNAEASLSFTVSVKLKDEVVMIPTTTKAHDFVMPLNLNVVQLTPEQYKTKVEAELEEHMVIFMQQESEKRLQEMANDKFAQQTKRVCQYMTQSPGTIMKICRKPCEWGMIGAAIGATGGTGVGMLCAGVGAVPGAVVGGTAGYAVGFVYGAWKDKTRQKGIFEQWLLKSEHRTLVPGLMQIFESSPLFEDCLDSIHQTFPMHPVVGPNGRIYDISTMNEILAQENPEDPFTRLPVTKDSFREDYRHFTRTHAAIVKYMDEAGEKLNPKYREVFEVIKRDMIAKRDLYFNTFQEKLDAQKKKGILSAPEYAVAIGDLARHLYGETMPQDKGDSKSNKN